MPDGHPDIRCVHAEEYLRSPGVTGPDRRTINGKFGGFGPGENHRVYENPPRAAAAAHTFLRCGFVTYDFLLPRANNFLFILLVLRADCPLFLIFRACPIRISFVP